MALSLVDKQIMWTRLIAAVGEQADALERTAFSSAVRESGDLAAGVFDAHGRMLAQAVTGTPGHINSMALAVGHVIARFPVETMREGDVFVHNDPWLGTGHTNDVSVTTPCFHEGRLVGFIACNSHIMDIGGLVDRSASRDVFMEGLYLPIVRLVDAGTINEALLEVIRANTRQPVETVGDIYSLMNCNDVGASAVTRMMAEFALADLDELADYIIDVSREAVLAEIRKLPKGSWTSEATLDGRDVPIVLRAKLTITDDSIEVDYTGTDGMTPYNFNVPLCYTKAYTSFALGCVIARAIPNNAGSLEPRLVTAPEGCILNATKPAAVLARAEIGLMLPDLVFGCLRQVLPELVPAEGASVLWALPVNGPRTPASGLNDVYYAQVITAGGMGALPFRDGLSATGFPSGVRGGSIEVFETMSSVIVWRKDLRPGSGGAGKWRGGLGQIIEIENGIDAPFNFGATFEHVRQPARGAFGGHSGATGSVRLRSGQSFGGKGQFTVPPGDRLIVESAGGGGWGEPSARAPEDIERDRRNGLVSADAAVPDGQHQSSTKDRS